MPAKVTIHVTVLGATAPEVFVVDRYDAEECEKELRKADGVLEFIAANGGYVYFPARNVTRVHVSGR